MPYVERIESLLPRLFETANRHHSENARTAALIAADALLLLLDLDAGKEGSGPATV